MKIFIQRIYSFKKTCELFIQQIYSFKKIGNYSFNENIHSIEKMGYRPPLLESEQEQFEKPIGMARNCPVQRIENY